MLTTASKEDVVEESRVVDKLEVKLVDEQRVVVVDVHGADGLDSDHYLWNPPLNQNLETERKRKLW